MIDLHCHILPGIDDGAPDLKTALSMAKMAVDDGIGTLACTPHIYPGLYDNTGSGIAEAADRFKAELANNAISLAIITGADVHLDFNLVPRLHSGEVPTLGGSRYFLLEFPDRVSLKGMENSVFDVLSAGYVPIITHPERQSWINDYYDEMVEMARRGAWLQVTANALTGRFGKRARYWSERMLDDGIVHLLATDAHNLTRRPPILSKGREAAVRWVGEEESIDLVLTRAQGVLSNTAPEALPLPPGLVGRKNTGRRGFLGRLRRALVGG